MRAPASTREKMSRPSSSSPNQWIADGPSRRLERSCAAGSKRATAGPNNAAITAMRTMAAPILLIANARIDEAVHQIRQQVHPDIRHRDQQNAPLHERIVAKADRLNQQASNAGPRKYRLRDNRSRQHGAELQADERDDGDQAVPKRMTDDG